MSRLAQLPLDLYARDAFARFEPDGAFHVGTARALGWLSQLTYEVRGAREKLEPILDAWELRLGSVLESAAPGLAWLPDTRGLAVCGRGATIIGFAGTDPLLWPNWLTNFELGPRERVLHAGFERAVQAVWPQVAAVIADRPPRQRALVFTGHSLGGALAVIAAARAAALADVTVTAVYTFGMPRPGGPAFAEAYAAAGLGEITFRLVHGFDIVPTVPPAGLGFCHVGRMVHCPHGEHFRGDMVPEPAVSNEPLLAATVAGGLRQRWVDVAMRRMLPSRRPGWIGIGVRLLPPALGDHVPDRYLGALDGAA